MLILVVVATTSQCRRGLVRTAVTHAVGLRQWLKMLILQLDLITDPIRWCHWLMIKTTTNISRNRIRPEFLKWTRTIARESKSISCFFFTLLFTNKISTVIKSINDSLQAIGIKTINPTTGELTLIRIWLSVSAVMLGVQLKRPMPVPGTGRLSRTVSWLSEFKTLPFGNVNSPTNCGPWRMKWKTWPNTGEYLTRPYATLMVHCKLLKNVWCSVKSEWASIEFMMMLKRLFAEKSPSSRNGKRSWRKWSTEPTSNKSKFLNLKMKKKMELKFE